MPQQCTEPAPDGQCAPTASSLAGSLTACNTGDDERIHEFGNRLSSAQWLRAPLRAALHWHGAAGAQPTREQLLELRRAHCGQERKEVIASTFAALLLTSEIGKCWS